MWTTGVLLVLTHCHIRKYCEFSHSTWWIWNHSYLTVYQRLTVAINRIKHIKASWDMIEKNMIRPIEHICSQTWQVPPTRQTFKCRKHTLNGGFFSKRCLIARRSTLRPLPQYHTGLATLTRNGGEVPISDTCIFWMGKRNCQPIRFGHLIFGQTQQPKHGRFPTACRWVAIRKASSTRRTLIRNRCWEQLRSGSWEMIGKTFWYPLISRRPMLLKRNVGRQESQEHVRPSPHLLTCKACTETSSLTLQNLNQLSSASESALVR